MNANPIFLRKQVKKKNKNNNYFLNLLSKKREIIFMKSHIYLLL